jgi:hypothetical protein
MSKMDDLRAMREARYAANAARAGERPAASRPRPPVAPPAVEGAAPRARTRKRAAAPAPAPAPAEPSASEQLCGHRNMSGRTCTREQGHAAKSHRYS